MSSARLNKYRSHAVNDLLKNWEPEILTPLPLPGEYIVLQLNPAAMAKHVGNLDLIKEFKKMQTKKYIAICGGYYELISDLKPWIMMHALLIYGEGEEDAEERPPAEDAPTDEEKHTPPPSSSGAKKAARKKTRIIQNICVRVHTRLCELPRVKPVEIPHDTFGSIKRYIIARSKSDFEETSRLPVRDMTLIRAPQTPMQDLVDPTLDEEYPAAEWETAPRELQLCLLPHCDYSFDLMQEISPGSELMEEHAQIIAMMRASIPEMPLKAKLPVDFYEPKPKSFYVEQPPEQIWFAAGLTEAPEHIRAKSERARRRAKEYNRRQTFFQRFFQPERRYWPTKEVASLQKKAEGLELPYYELLVFAPPSILNGDATLGPADKSRRSWRVWLKDLLAEIRVRLAHMFWIPPDYLEPLDDVPYIPFSQWDELSKKGDIKRWLTDPRDIAVSRQERVINLDDEDAYDYW